MTEMTISGTERSSGRTMPFESAVVIVVLVAALSQHSIGAIYDKTGEQVSGGVPIPTLILFLGVLAVLIKRREFIAPVPDWAHIVFLCTASIGLLGLSKWELKSGIKEAIQIGEVFGLSWYLLASCKRDSLKEIGKGMGLIGVILLFIGVGRAYEYPPFELSEARWAGLQLATIPFVYFIFRDKPRVLTILLGVIALVNGIFLKNGGMLLGMILIVPICAWIIVRKVKYVAVGASLLMVAISLLVPGTKAWESLRPQYDETYRKRLFVEYSASLLTPRYYPGGGGAGRYKQTINVVKQYMNAEVSPLEDKIPEDSNSQYLVTLVETGWPALLALTGVLVVAVLTNFSARPSPDALAFAVGLSALCLLGAGLYTTTLGRGIGIWLGAILGLTTVIGSGSRHDPKELLTRLAAPLGFFLITGGVMMGFNKGEKNEEHVSKMNQRMRAELPFTAPYNPPPSESEPTLKIIKTNGNTVAADRVKILKEAEDVFLVSGHIKQAVVADASGSKALVIPLNSGKGIGRAEYKVSVPEKGMYRARVRVYWEDGCSNSLRFNCFGGKQLFASERFKEWHSLTSRKLFELPAGDQLITIENTEDGIKLDYFELEKVEEGE